MTQLMHEQAPAAGPIPVLQHRAAARTKDLSDLLERRPELAGVYGPADLTAEAVRWSA